MRRWGPLLTSPSPYQSSDHSDVPLLHKGSPSSLGNSLPYRETRGKGGWPGWGLPVGLSMGRGSSAGSACPSTPRSAGHLQSPQDTHPYSQVHPQKHTPRDLAVRSIHPRKHIQRFTPSTLVCHVKRIPILAPAWDLGASPFWSQPHLFPV